MKTLAERLKANMIATQIVQLDWTINNFLEVNLDLDILQPYETTLPYGNTEAALIQSCIMDEVASKYWKCWIPKKAAETTAAQARWDGIKADLIGEFNLSM